VVARTIRVVLPGNKVLLGKLRNPNRENGWEGKKRPHPQKTQAGRGTNQEFRGKTGCIWNTEPMGVVRTDTYTIGKNWGLNPSV